MHFPPAKEWFIPWASRVLFPFNVFFWIDVHRFGTWNNSLILNCMGPLFPWIYVSHLWAVRHHFYFLGLNTGSNHHLRGLPFPTHLSLTEMIWPIQLEVCKATFKIMAHSSTGRKNKTKQKQIWAWEGYYASNFLNPQLKSYTMAYHELIRQTVPFLCDFQMIHKECCYLHQVTVQFIMFNIMFNP